MSRRKPSYFRMLLAVGGLSAILPLGTVFGKPLQSEIDRLFAKWDRPESPGCAVGVIQDGELVFEKGYGMADVEGGKAIDGRTLFNAATLSRYFTGAAAAWLIDNGAIHLGDNIRVCVPEMPRVEPAITVEDLIYHTSGLADYTAVWKKSGMGETDDALEIVDLLAEARLQFVPGRRVGVSRGNYFMLGFVSGRVVSASLAEWAEGVIFGPAGMESTVFCDHPEKMPAGAVGYKPKLFGGYARAVNPLPRIAGDVGLYTNLVDLAAWEKSVMERKPNTAGFYDLLERTGKTEGGRPIDYAFGLDVGKYRGLKVFSHFGRANGFSAGMMRFPEKRMTVICLSNLESIQTAPFVKKVADLYLGRDWER